MKYTRYASFVKIWRETPRLHAHRCACSNILVANFSGIVSCVTCFEMLCGLRQCKNLQKEYPFMCNVEDANFIDEECDWTSAKHWAQWWATHLKMLSCVFSYVPETWKTCPTTTNAVERKNYECKTDTPQSLKLAMINVYKLGKNTCCKHIAAKNRCSISYRSRDEEAHKQNAESQRRQHAIAFNSNKAAQHGPLDRSTNFNCSKAVQKRKRN